MLPINGILPRTYTTFTFASRTVWADSPPVEYDQAEEIARTKAADLLKVPADKILLNNVNSVNGSPVIMVKVGEHGQHTNTLWYEYDKRAN